MLQTDWRNNHARLDALRHPYRYHLFFIYRRTKRTIGFQSLLRAAQIPSHVIQHPGNRHFPTRLRPSHSFHRLFDWPCCGAGLGLTAIRHTRFEHRADGWYYRTHLWIEIAVLVLFLSRIIYRVAFIALSPTPTSMNPADLTQFTKIR